MKKKRNTSLFPLLLLMLGCAEPQHEHNIGVIPKPESLKATNAGFQITSETKILARAEDSEALRIAGMLSQKLETAAGFNTTAAAAADHPSNNAILFASSVADTSLGDEGYRIVVTDQLVTINAAKPAGWFYGMKTLLQLLPAEIESLQLVKGIAWTIPGVEITDKPRFKWRGMHLDVSRHFIPLDFIKKYIDYLAAHKLNTFHWHLTDDQGWRLEIKQYPLLTKIGAWRKESMINTNDKSIPLSYDNTPHGGFYTQDEVREIVQYAKDRFINVVPEIEMPGHAIAAIASYPELGVTGKKIDVATRWDIVFPDIFNVRDSTFRFLENVLAEVMDIFPSQYIHIGGDEVIKDQWQASEEIQQKIRQLSLKDEHELQSYFVKHIERFINSKGRKMIGWEEILQGGLAPNATLMSWRGIEGGITAAKSGHDVVMTPIQYLYFWTYQGNRRVEPMAAAKGYITLEKVYEFEPVPSELTVEEAKHILGAQACAWTEYMEDPGKVEYMVFPRMSALAEIVWSPQKVRNWKDFSERMDKQFKRYYYMGINYAKVPLDIGTKED